jgi:2-polyprenyl-3-methyl-5-hydroxy-6-metoxy-1,4-benzoquinol methylase
MRLEPLPPELHEDLRCIVCGNEKPDDFGLRYCAENYAVVVCKKCDFHFIPPWYRKKIRYEQYKSADVTIAVRAGNNSLKVERHRLRMQFIRKFIKKGSLFDLGAGWGHFMLAARDAGFEVSGIEISEQPYRFCVEDLRLPVEHMNFFDMKEIRSYDVITMWDVLEHIDAADKFMAKCARMISPGGYLVLQVPQIDSALAKLHGENWKMMGLDHVNYFSRKTMRQFLQKHGFEVRKFRSSFELKLFVMYTLLPLLKKFTGNRKKKLREINSTISAAERQNYFNRMANRPSWQLRLFVLLHNAVYKSMSFFRIGEEMMVAAQKVR